MKILIMFLLTLTGASAQQNSVPFYVTATTPLITCPKYQHLQQTPSHCEFICDANSYICSTECKNVPAINECKDDIHFVTEREWQELTERLKKLEEKSKILVKKIKHLYLQLGTSCYIIEI